MQVAEKVFEAIAAREFYIYSHPHALGNVQSRMEAIVNHRKSTTRTLRRRG